MEKEKSVFSTSEEAFSTISIKRGTEEGYRKIDILMKEEEDSKERSHYSTTVITGELSKAYHAFVANQQQAEHQR